MGLLDETHSIFRCIEMKTTLEQWQLLQAVVELGSYNKAAEQFHRTQSSVSYQLGILQERLGIPLLTIVGRKAELTEAGHDLLAQAAVLLEGMHALEARAEAILQGERTHIHLVVDSIFPKTMLFSVLEKFHQQHPQTQVHLTEILRSESLRQLAKHTGDLYLIHLPTVAQHQGKLLLEIGFVAVACRDHALLHKPQPLHERDLAQYPGLKLSIGKPRNIRSRPPPRQSTGRSHRLTLRLKPSGMVWDMAGCRKTRSSHCWRKEFWCPYPCRVAADAAHHSIWWKTHRWNRMPHWLP